METTIDYYIIMGLYRDNGKENGNYYIIMGFIGIMKKRRETTILSWVANPENSNLSGYCSSDLWELRVIGFRNGNKAPMEPSKICKLHKDKRRSL